LRQTHDWAHWGPRIAALVRTEGRNWTSIKEALGPGCPGAEAMRAYFDRHPGLFDTFGGRVEPVIIQRPFEVPLPYLPQGEQGEMVKAVLYGDVHFPNQDDRALAVLMAVVADYEPDVLVCMGDLLDCYLLSAFDKNPAVLSTLQDEIDMARTHLHQMAQIAPNARRIFLEGNHEDRLRRLLWNLQDRNRTLTTLRDVNEALEWTSLLHLDEIGWEFVPHLGSAQANQNVLPKFLLKHGTVVRKWSGWSARAEWERYGKSGASGHCHRLGMFFHRDLRGNHVWVETGCLCDLEPDWLPSPDWQNGFVVASFEKETGAFAIEPVYIHNGSAMWRGKFYKG
jgi:hypothetical protein